MPDRTDLTPVDAVEWLISLPEGDAGPTRRVREDLATMPGALPLRERQIATTAEFRAVMAELSGRAREGYRPLLALDAHGDRRTGLKLAPSGDTVPWADLARELRGLNVSANHQLIVVLALCHGVEAALKDPGGPPLPFHILFAPKAEVTSGLIEKGLRAFFSYLASSDDIKAAYEKGLSQCMDVYNSDDIAFQLLALYCVNFCKGSGRQERLESLLSIVVSHQGDDDIARHRKYIRAQLTFSDAHFALIEKAYAGDRGLPFTREDVLRAAEARARARARRR